MNTTAHDFVTVDMRGLKAALVARAQADRVSVSVLVRGAVARDLGLAADGETSRIDEQTERQSSVTPVKLSIRMTAAEARQLAAGARTAGLSRGASLSTLGAFGASARASREATVAVGAMAVASLVPEEPSVLDQEPPAPAHVIPQQRPLVRPVWRSRET